MSGYRFCRSDDVPLLVRAYEECYRVHFPELPELTVERFKLAARELNLWTSSCMVAYANDDLIGVVLAAKRGTENWIHSVGVHPEHLRQGHGRHMLDSLRQKLAILGPRRIVAEIPAGLAAARSFFDACGYAAETSYTDWTLEPSPKPLAAAGIVVPVTLDQIDEAGLFDRTAHRAWERAPETLLNEKERLRGLAVAGGERIEAWLLADETGPERRIADCGVRDAARGAVLLGVLVDHYARSGDGAVRIARVHPAEPCAEHLEAWGFYPGPQTIGYAIQS